MTPPPADTAVAAPPKERLSLPFGGEMLTRGVVLTWLSIIVLIPLGAVVFRSFDEGLGAFWDAISEPEAVAAIKLTVIASLIIVVINAVMGTIIAWVLVRDEFRGKKIVNSIIDLPFALPTIVAGLTLLALYGNDSPINVNITYTRIAVGLALLFVTLPFVVRAVQPVLHEIDEEMEEAAASLGASNFKIFRSIVLPNLTPGDHRRLRARLRSRDRRVRLPGADHREHPVRHPGRLRLHLRPHRKRQRDRRRRRRRASCSSLRSRSCSPSICSDAGGPVMSAPSPFARYGMRWLALTYLAFLLLIPLVMIFFKTFEDGIQATDRRGHQRGGPARLLADDRLRRHRRAAEHDLRDPLRADAGPAQVPGQGHHQLADRPAVRGLSGRDRARAVPRLRRRTGSSEAPSTTPGSRSSSRRPGLSWRRSSSRCPSWSAR